MALWLRDRLARDGLTAYPKTSGSKGLHLLTPLRPTDTELVQTYARQLAVEAEAALPELAVHRMARQLRVGKVFVDHSQNNHAKTTAAPYTLRARHRPTVSTPVSWEELSAVDSPDDLVFLADEIPARLSRHGELMEPLCDAGDAPPLPTVTAQRRR